MEDSMKLMSNENEHLKSKIDSRLSLQPVNFHDDKFISTPVSKEHNMKHNHTNSSMTAGKYMEDLPRKGDNSADMMSIYKKKIMEKKNLSSHINSTVEDNDMSGCVYKKNRDLTPLVRHVNQSKNITVSPYRLDDKNHLNLSVNKQIMSNRSNINIKKRFLGGKIEDEDQNNFLSGDEMESEKPHNPRLRPSNK